MQVWKKPVINWKHIGSEIFRTISLKHQNNIWKLEIDFPLMEKKFNQGFNLLILLTLPNESQLSNLKQEFM